jgi:AAA domain-containing protein/UvrD-like helicase family protein
MNAVTDRRLTAADLSPDQRQVYDAMLEWSRFPFAEVSLLTVGGYAGTGKSTLLGVFAASTELTVAYVSFTGRASSVLGRKLAASGVRTASKLKPPEGMRQTTKASRFYDFSLTGGVNDPPFCGTIHRLLYHPIINEKTEELLGWTKRDSLDRDYSLIVIDEASMVSDDILADLQVHKVPILAVGDHGQLPPVAAAGSLMENPDLRLERIHRQAEGNPIIQLSRSVRETGWLDRKWADGSRVRFVKRADTATIEKAFGEAKSTGDLLSLGLLCWTNKTRIRMNAHARRGCGFQGVPNEGEVVICLKNKPPVFNGMRGVLASPGKLDKWRVSASIAFPEEGLPPMPIAMCAGQFNREKPFRDLEELHKRGIEVWSMGDAGDLFDFGYAMTVHKSQGSQFDHAMFYVDRPENGGDDWRRFAYTAVTRAANRLTVLV